ncbi:MAG TPA: 16S rRNA (cytidine(1402)-2'-O)-methyltransferase [Opitutae bacterium]|nr:16S rRNA (cytidine(1402)-2'-O)-methyltransferase [Opitutae bacterium]
MGDVSSRAKSILGNCRWVACEDTREGAKLFSLMEIECPQLLSYHDQNEQRQTSKLIDILLAGNDVSLISDAGMPCISDPGFRVVRECRRLGIPVTAIPGPVAFTTALSISGLPSNGCLFVGFLPPKTSARCAFFQKYADFEYTLACYESCHRIEKFLNDLIATLGPDRVICVARELTKIHETVTSGPASSVLSIIAGKNKGEFVVLISPKTFQL